MGRGFESLRRLPFSTDARRLPKLSGNQEADVIPHTLHEGDTGGHHHRLSGSDFLPVNYASQDHAQPRKLVLNKETLRQLTPD